MAKDYTKPRHIDLKDIEEDEDVESGKDNA
jgi:hypothetical protein